MPENEKNEDKIYKYDAFISYRHTLPDSTVAAGLQTMIEKFKVPKFLGTRNHNRQFRVFRDRDELTTKDLSTMIQEALKDSEFLIVVCSKRTPLSPWCTKEVHEFRKTHDDSKIIPLLIEGEPEESFNAELKTLKMRFVNTDNTEEEKELELLAADIRPDEVKFPSFKGYEELEKSKDPMLQDLTRKSLSLLKKTEIYRIMATILDVSYGDLKLRHRERALKRIIYASVFSSIAMLIFGISVTSLYIKSVISERKANEQSSLMTLNMADTSNEEGNRFLSLLIAREAMRKVNPKMDQYDKIMAQYTRVLNDSLLALPYSSEFIFPTNTQYSFFAVSKDSRWIIANGNLNNAHVYSLENGARLKTLTFESPVTSFAVSPDNRKIFTGTADGKIFSVDAQNYEKSEIMNKSENITTGMAVSPDGKYLYVRKGPFILEVLNTSTLQKLSVVTFEKDNTLKVFKINPVTNNFFIITADNSLKEYDVLTGKLLKQHADPTHNKYSFSRVMNISENGILAYSDPVDTAYRIVIKNLNTGQINYGNNILAQPFSIQISDTGNYLFVSDKRSLISRFNIQNLSQGEEINKTERTAYYMTTENNYIKNIFLSPNEKILMAVMENNKIEVFEGVDVAGAPISYVSDSGKYNGDILISEFTPDNRKIVTSSFDGFIRVINSMSTVETHSLQGRIIGSSRDKNNLLIYNDGNLIRYNFTDNKTTVLGKPAKEFFHMYASFASNNDVSLVALSSLNGEAADIFDVKSKTRIYTTKFHETSPGKIPFIKKVEFSMDGKYVFTLGSDNKIFVSEAKTGKFLFSMENRENGEASTFTLSNDDNFIAVNYVTGKTSIFSLDTKEVIKTLDGEILHIENKGKDLKKLYGQHGNRLFYYIPDKKPVYYTDNNERQGSRNITLNNETVSSDGKYLIVNIASNDTIIIDLATGEKIRTLKTAREFLNSIPVINFNNTRIAYSYDKDKILITEMYTTEKLSEMAANLLKKREMTDEEYNYIGRRR